MYHWLLLNSGLVVIGSRNEGQRISWAVLYPDGMMGAVNETSVVDSKPLSIPPVTTTHETRKVCNYSWA